jgi:hypothetical protein
MLAHHLRRLGCIWTTCTPSLASQTRWSVCTPFLVSETCLEHLHAVSGVPDVFGTLARRSWHPRCVWNTCTPFLVSQARLEHLHAVFCVSECLHAVSGSSDASVLLECHLRCLRCIYNTCTPFSASRTRLRRLDLHAISGVSDTSVTPAGRSQRLGVCNIFMPSPGLGCVYRGYWPSYDSFVTNHYDSLLV